MRKNCLVPTMLVLLAALSLPGFARAAYVDTLNALGPVSYWNLNETSGFNAADSVPLDAIDGNKPFKLFTKDDSAWTVDAATDGAIAEAMRKGRSMTIIGTSARGTKTTDTYSLAGYTAAQGAIDKECKG